MQKVISVNAVGVATFVRDETFAGLAARGESVITRASHVEPVNPFERILFRILRNVLGETGKVAEWTRKWRGQWLADMGPSGGPVLGPFPRRATAIEHEMEWLNQNPFKVSPMKLTPEDLAKLMKQEILEDVRLGRVPRTVASFSELHDYVDANCYGGTEKLLEDLDAECPDTDEAHTTALNTLFDILNPAMDIVDRWIKSGNLMNVEITSGKESHT